MKWAAKDTRDAGALAIRIMDAVVAQNDSVLKEICSEIWVSLDMFSSVMAMLPKPVKDYLGEHIMTHENGYRVGSFGVNA